MASKRELVLQALFDALSGIDTGARVLRNEMLPERVPESGILIVRDGDPGEPEILLSPPEYVYEHRAEVEVVVEGATAQARDQLFDSLLQAVGAAVAADRTLGGLCDYVEAQAPAPVDLPIEGAPGLKAAVVPIVLHYGAADPIAA